jgi:hypothetical protein
MTHKKWIKLSPEEQQVKVAEYDGYICDLLEENRYDHLGRRLGHRCDKGTCILPSYLA